MPSLPRFQAEMGLSREGQGELIHDIIRGHDKSRHQESKRIYEGQGMADAPSRRRARA